MAESQLWLIDPDIADMEYLSFNGTENVDETLTHIVSDDDDDDSDSEASTVAKEQEDSDSKMKMTTKTMNTTKQMIHKGTKYGKSRRRWWRIRKSGIYHTHPLYTTL